MTRMPCGNCDIGTYSVQPVLNGVKAFEGSATKREAINRAPRCKIEPNKVCAGAMDWLAGTGFPITSEQCRQIEQWCRS